MFPVPLVISSNTITQAQFWDSLLVYHNRPHLVNRKLAGHSQVLFCEITFDSDHIKKLPELFTRSAVLYEVRKFKTLSKETVTVDFLRNLIECYDKKAVFTPTSVEVFRYAKEGIFISLRILFPRVRGCDSCIEVVILDKSKNEAVFHAVMEDCKNSVAPPFPYTIELDSSGNLRIILDSIEYADTGSARWLSEKLFEKLIKWSVDRDEDKVVPSLSLIDVEEYCILYGSLKAKYTEPLLKAWHEKTSTDPKKYIHEDIAIATYLICLWHEHNFDGNINFVDVGCGNGLLVYILNREGYKGYGVDLRRRKTWDLYNNLADLRVETVTPTSVYPESNWLIGNHSDELTPWIPIMALKSSPTTNFFVLPCCSYDLNGKKFIRRNSSVSQYNDYLSYVEKICHLCHFHSYVDKLKIPSTRRTCIVGIQDLFDDNAYQETLREVDDFIKLKCSSGTEDVSIALRPSTEKVRNCTQLDRSIISDIINTIVRILLKTEFFIRKDNGEQWNKGGQVSLKDLSKEIPNVLLKKLKDECGGLQTLLRNHQYIFEVKNGLVSLREPMLLSQTEKYKRKPCWFQKSHPHGCLYNSEICAYKHE